jgi:hypothetical protein
MSRGDEIEEGEPRPPVRRWSEYEDEADTPPRPPRARKSQPSGAVSGVGITAIILGSLGLMCGACGAFGGVCFAGFMPWLQQELARVAPQDPQAAQMAKDMEQLQSVGWLVIAESILSIVIGGGLIVAGIGVVRRSNLARWLTLGLAVVNVLSDFVDLLVKLVFGLFHAGDAASTAVSIVIAISFAVFAFVVLLNPRNAAEFAEA